MHNSDTAVVDSTTQRERESERREKKGLSIALVFMTQRVYVSVCVGLALWRELQL